MEPILKTRSKFESTAWQDWMHFLFLTVSALVLFLCFDYLDSNFERIVEDFTAPRETLKVPPAFLLAGELFVTEDPEDPKDFTVFYLWTGEEWKLFIIQGGPPNETNPKP